MTTFLRKHTADQYRHIRKILRGTEPEIDRSPADLDNAYSWGLFWVSVMVAVLMLFGPCSPAHAYTDEQYANAIRHAEGTWTYGIKTVKCTSEASCRRVALQTIRNNRVRFAKYGFRHYPSFTQFLGSRYCPTTGRNRTPCEIRLNRFWIANVSYFLKNERIS